MPDYLVEVYAPRTGAGGAQDVAARAASAERAGVRLLGTLFLPEDETCFLLYEAASAELVAEAARSARIRAERIQSAEGISRSRPCARSRSAHAPRSPAAP